MGTTVIASGTVSRVYFAQAYLETHQTQDHSAFMLGALLPYRYNFSSASLQDITNEKSSFCAGVLFQCYHEGKRHHFMKEYGICDLIERVPHNEDFLRFVEDELLFDYCDQIEIIEMLNTILPEERDWESDEDALIEQHDALQDSLMYLPSSIIDVYRFSEEGFLTYSPQQLSDWHEYFPGIVENPLVKDYAHDLRIYLLNDFE